MGKEDSTDDGPHDAKRPRLGDAVAEEQRAAFAEDLAQIRAAVGDGAGAPPAAADAPSGVDGEAAGEATGNHGDEAAPSGPQGQEAQAAAARQPTAAPDSDDEEGEGNWLKNFTPHHTRVGSDYQVAELPAAGAALPRPEAQATTSGSCVSPGSSG